MATHKQQLLNRRIRKMTEQNWFEWGALRNMTTIEKNIGKPCIYVKNITRNKEIAFIGSVMYFGGSLLCMIPKNDTLDLNLIVNYLNTPEFQKDYIYSNRFKIGQKQLSNATINSLC